MLDLDCIYDSYTGLGAPPYDPAMMLKLLLFAYSIGVTSSREMERRCHTHVAFRWLSANAAPDYRSLSRFRRRHLFAIDTLFVQALARAPRRVWSNSPVALDGTKLRASASRHKAMSYDRIGPQIEELEAQVAALLAEAEAKDLPKTKSSVRTGGVTSSHPNWPPRRAAWPSYASPRRPSRPRPGRRRCKRLSKRPKKRGQRGGGPGRRGEGRRGGHPVRSGPAHFTDPESRMMKTNDGYQYAFNAQAMVDEGAQVIVAHSVSNQASDAQQLMEMIEATDTNLGAGAVTRTPTRTSPTPATSREPVEQAETGIHRDTSDVDQLLIFRRVVPADGRLMVGKPHECP